MSFSFLGQGNDPNKASFRGQNFPTSVQPLADLTPTRWLAERIRPVGRGDGVHLWSIVPEGYPAYARILHPADCPLDDSPIRWVDIAARNDKTVHPLMQFGRLSGSDDPYGHPYWADKPLIGQLQKQRLSYQPFAISPRPRSNAVYSYGRDTVELSLSTRLAKSLNCPPGVT